MAQLTEASKLNMVLDTLPPNKRSRLESLIGGGRECVATSPPAITPSPRVFAQATDTALPSAGGVSALPTETRNAANTIVASARAPVPNQVPVITAANVSYDMNNSGETSATARHESQIEALHASNSNSYSIGMQLEAWSRASRGEPNADGDYSQNNVSDADERKPKRNKVDLTDAQSPDQDTKELKQKGLVSFFKVVKTGGESRTAKPSGQSRNSAGSSGTSSHAHDNSTARSPNELIMALEITKEAKKALERDNELKGRELEAVRNQKSDIENKNTKLRKKLEETHRSMAREAARRNRDRLAADSVRLGKFTVVRVGESVGEAFEKGYAFHELQTQRENIQKRKEELEQRKQELTKQKRSFNKKRNAALNYSNSVNALLDDETIDIEMDLDLLAEQHAIGIHTERLKKEEAGLAEKEKLLDAERGSHEKELRRVQCEDKSRYYRDLPLLGEGRYSLLRLLGQGGFSEVWLALDLFTLEEVAVKIHQLNSAWTTDRQRAFVRHAKRELEIHESINHPRIVKLIGCFDISNDAFATILEYCRGTDLDELLKRNKGGLTEKEAKPILLQILSGLRYINPLVIGDERKTIIHYDLKPANILFDEMGDVKITDFGLSKVVDNESDGTSIDQTSHGAGTYWYLPPECFTKDKISSKVDVWSVGVIYYQMLYGRRPFGEGLTQHTIYKDGTILNARQVEFPSTTDTKSGNKVSEEAKEFIRGCLTYDQALRWDVNQMCLATYVRAR